MSTTLCFEVKYDDKGEEILVPRSLDIDAWLKTNSFKGVFCILDDQPDMRLHQDCLVQTNDKDGLVEQDIHKAISLLRAEQTVL